MDRAGCSRSDPLCFPSPPPPSFLVGQDGGVYEGVGWRFQGSHTFGYNDIGLGVAFMGDFGGKERAWGGGSGCGASRGDLAEPGHAAGTF